MELIYRVCLGMQWQENGALVNEGMFLSIGSGGDN